MQKNINLGWIGLGVMGEPLCHHLIQAGYSLSVFTRSPERAKSVIDAGANWCDTPAMVALQSDMIFTMVGEADEVKQVYQSEQGLFTTDIRELVFVDMGTTSPALTQDLFVFASNNNASFIDAPVSGGDIGARNAKLSIMAGGDEEVFKQVKPFFDCLGSAKYMGKSGSGQHTKMCNQITIAGTMIGVCEALYYAQQSGLDAEKMIAVIARGAAACWTLDNLAPRMIDRDFASGFMVNHFIKDLGIALEETENMQISLPGLNLAKKLYEKVQSMGHGKNATQSLLLALQDR